MKRERSFVSSQISSWLGTVPFVRAQALGTFSNPAVSGVQIYEAGLPSGNYYIKPSGYTGDPKLLYVENSFQGGGWVLVAKGRESSDANAWWNNSSYNESELVSASRTTTSVARTDSTFVNTLIGGSWSANTKFVVNRAEVGDSWIYLLPSGRTFAWTDFGGSQNSSNAPVSATSGSRYSGAWLSGSVNTATNFNYWDWYAQGGSNNNETRMFSWWWSGHGNFRGWSAGSTVTNGFQAGTEGHAIQTVQIYVK